MREVQLVRKEYHADYVIGELILDDGWSCRTVERPDLGDLPDVSCIAEGRWQCAMAWSPSHSRRLYHVAEPNRKEIEIHSANVAEQIKGCIALGLERAAFKSGSIHSGVPAKDTVGVADSVRAIEEFHRRMRNEPFVLVVSKERA